MADKKGAHSEKTLYCSFCGKSQHEVKKLIAGPSVFICDECIDLCNDIIRDELPPSTMGRQAQGEALPTPLEIKQHLDNYVIGAGDGGVVRELTRYDRVERIDLVEMDPQVVEACRAYLPGNACRMDDRRVHIYFENALKYIRRCEADYDLIIVDSSDPFGPSEGLFTREFYGSCFNALKEDGIMVNQQGSPFYAEDATAMQRSHKRIASTFPISKVYQAHIPTFAAGYWLFGFASKKYHPINDMDADAWNALNMRTRYYTSRLHVGAFYLPAFLEEMLREVEEH